MSIQSLTPEQAIEIVRETAIKARRKRDLEIVLGNNGRTGRNATGNYSLLARATGLHRVHVGKVLKGLVGASHSTLIRLSEVTGISVGDISKFIQERTNKAA